ncbi:MAG: diguanylate cyclase [Pyrinomonadaceae bacterium]
MNLFRTHKVTTPTIIASAVAVLAGGLLVWWLLGYFGKDLIFILLPIIIFAVVTHRVYRHRLAQKTSEIFEASRVHLATVEALATAIDARDQVGAGHVRRTQIYAVGLGNLLGLPEREINALRTGALLHDIGKLAIPDHILSKTDKLTPAELEKTKIHSKVGASILEKVGFTYPVVPTVRHHHESWDGKGYPDGLKGQAIPLTARVLAVADGFDTLRSIRPYRAAHSREQARQIIQAEAGTRFDPAIVSLLIRNLQTLEADLVANDLGYSDTTDRKTVTEQNSYVEQIKLANREVFSLYELAREFSATVNLQETLVLFASKIKEFVPFDTCSLYLLNASRTSASAAYVRGAHSDLLARRLIKVGQGATGYALKTHKLVQNVDPDLDFLHSHTDLAGQYWTMASIPLIADNELVGAVTLYSKSLEEYGEDHIRLLDTISNIGADAIGKSLKHDEATTYAMTDPMTGLPNARSLQVQFEKEIARARRVGSSFQLLMLDLDGFKAVNDTYGHKVGDEMLREVSQVILGQLRDYDFLARYGGDEFVALIPESQPSAVIDLSARIEKAVAEFALPVAEGKTASVGVSLGAAGFPDFGDSFDQMIVAADKAMYDRKSDRKRFGFATEIGRPRTATDDDSVDKETALIVELDERHVVSSNAIN